MRSLVLLLAIMLFTGLAQAGDVPHVFSAGETVSSSKINENFAALGVSITNRSIGYALSMEQSGSEFAELSCADGETLVGGSCSCFHPDFDASTTNYGVPMFCGMDGNSIFGACVPNYWSYSPAKYGPPVTVYATCAKTGTPVPLKALSVGSKAVDEGRERYREYLLSR